MECLLNWWRSLTTSDIITLLGIFIPIVIGGLFYWKKNEILADFQKNIDKHQAKLRDKSKGVQNELDQKLESHKADLLRTTNELQEKLRIEHSLIFAERLTVFKESIRLIKELDKLLLQLYSYYTYDCKENLDYSTDVCEKGKCQKDCIVNYWDKTVSVDKVIQDIKDYVNTNEMFFSAQQIISLYDIIAEITELQDRVWKIKLNHELQEKSQALAIFEEYYCFRLKNAVFDYRSELVNSYRKIIKVPEIE